MGKRKQPVAKRKPPHKTAVVSTVASFRSAPLPPPNELEHYTKILPSAAERIFTMAEENNKVARDAVDRTTRAETFALLFTVICVFVLPAIFVGATIALAYLGFGTASVLSATGGVLFAGSKVISELRKKN